MPGDAKAGYDRADKLLARHPGLKVVRLQARGTFSIAYAWQARGTGAAGTVTDAGAKAFQERLAVARKAFEDAWALKGYRPDSCENML